MFVIATILILIQVLASHLITDAKKPSSGSADVYDMMLTDRVVKLGLVSTKLSDGHFCVVVNELLNRLGYQNKSSSVNCMSLEDILSSYGIPLTIDMSSVELLISQDFDYPAKAYRKAMDRIQRTKVDHMQSSLILFGYRPSLQPQTKRFDLTLRNYSRSLSRPEIHSIISGELLGGTFRSSGMAASTSNVDPYSLQTLDYSWFWKPIRPSSLLTSFEFGSRLYDPFRRTALSGFRITNKPISSRDTRFSDQLKVSAPTGSIVEWFNPSGYSGHHIVDETGIYTLNSTLGFGLNKINYAITAPGELTKEIETWVRIPTQLTPKGRLEYHATFGKLKWLPNTQLAYTSVDYGAGNRLSFGVDQAAHYLNGQLRSQMGSRFVLRPTATSEINGSLNSSSEYSIRASYWNPRMLTVELSDQQLSANFVNNSRFDRRHSMLRAMLHTNSRVRPQVIVDRTGHINSTSTSIKGNVSTNTHKWILAANTGYQWWKNGETRITGYTNVLGHISYRVMNKLVIGGDVSSTISNRYRVDWLRLYSFYSTPKLQIGTNMTVHTTTHQHSIGFSARIHTDWLTSNSQYELYNHTLYGSQSITTSWMKSQGADWYPSTQSGLRSSGIVLIPFHDVNGNGIKDQNERVLSGLMGSLREGRIIHPKHYPYKLMFSELQPFRNYLISLSADLRDDPDYLVQNTRISVESPGSGFRLIYVPVAKSIEVTGNWDLGDRSVVMPGRTGLIMTRTDGSQTVRGTLFGDGTWIVDRAVPGTYHVTVTSGSSMELVASPSVITIESQSKNGVPKITISAKT